MSGWVVIWMNVCMCVDVLMNQRLRRRASGFGRGEVLFLHYLTIY